MNNQAPISGPEFDALCLFIARLQQGEVSSTDAQTLGVQPGKRLFKVLAYFGYVVAPQKRLVYLYGKPKLETWYVLLARP